MLSVLCVTLGDLRHCYFLSAVCLPGGCYVSLEEKNCKLALIKKWRRLSFLLSFSPPQTCTHPSVHPEKNCFVFSSMVRQRAILRSLVSFWDFDTLSFLLSLLPCITTSEPWGCVCSDLGLLPWRMLELILVLSFFWNNLAHTLYAAMVGTLL